MSIKRDVTQLEEVIGYLGYTSDTLLDLSQRPVFKQFLARFTASQRDLVTAIEQLKQISKQVRKDMNLEYSRSLIDDK